jgi:hypothetical protein
MLRLGLGLGILAVLSTLAGCTMCCHPYDWCGPVHDGEGCQSCDSRYRVGSILAGTAETATLHEVGADVTTQGMADEPIVDGQTRVSAKHARSEPSVAAVADSGRRQRYMQQTGKMGDVPGSEKVISVTDRVVEPGATVSEASATPSEPALTADSPATTQGWTARRPAH